jgi:hypothetical protein
VGAARRRCNREHDRCRDASKNCEPELQHSSSPKLGGFGPHTRTALSFGRGDRRVSSLVAVAPNTEMCGGPAKAAAQ